MSDETRTINWTKPNVFTFLAVSMFAVTNGLRQSIPVVDANGSWLFPLIGGVLGLSLRTYRSEISNFTPNNEIEYIVANEQIRSLCDTLRVTSITLFAGFLIKINEINDIEILWIAMLLIFSGYINFLSRDLLSLLKSDPAKPKE